MLVQRPKSIASQVADIVKDRISSQEYPPGSKLPSEHRLADELGVSRSSVRGALGTLAAEGLVMRRQGDGTYVNPHLGSIPTRLGGMWDFLRLIEYSGHQPTIQLVEQRAREASPGEKEALALTDAGQVLSLTRLFCADQLPVILARSAVPLQSLLVPPEECDGRLPVRDFIGHYCQRRVSYTIFEIEATYADTITSEWLQLAGNTPLLKLDQTFHDQENQPVFHTCSYFQDKSIRLRLVQAWY